MDTCIYHVFSVQLFRLSARSKGTYRLPCVSGKHETDTYPFFFSCRCNIPLFPHPTRLIRHKCISPPRISKYLLSHPLSLPHRLISLRQHYLLVCGICGNKYTVVIPSNPNMRITEYGASSPYSQVGRQVVPMSTSVFSHQSLDEPGIRQGRIAG